MTTYNGSNMGLEQNADGTWVFTNPAQTFIDPATFSTPDPEFPTAPVDDDDDEVDTTCEEGYIYDSTLKKCVPEVTEYEEQVAAYTDSDSERDYAKEAQENYVDFREMSYDEMVDFGKKAGFFNAAGTFIGAPDTKVQFPMIKGLAQFGLDSQANRFAINFAKKGGKVWNPNEPSFIGNLYIPKRDDLARLIAGTGTFDIASDYNKKVHDFGVTAMNKVKVIPDIQDKTQQRDIIKNRIEEEKARKAKIEADATQVELNRKKVEAEKDVQETIRKAEKQEKKKQEVREEYKDKGQVTYSTKDTGGYVTTPNIPSAPPSERGGGGYVKPTSYERPGTKGARGHHW